MVKEASSREWPTLFKLNFVKDKASLSKDRYINFVTSTEVASLFFLSTYNVVIYK